MKAISIKEPWASMILSGVKKIETRTWQTPFRGKILLCASKTPKSKISGYAFAIAELVDIQPMTKAHEKSACCEVYPGAYSWFLNDIRPLLTAFEVKGKLGLFDVKVQK